jgi:hypothetical protein
MVSTSAFCGDSLRPSYSTAVKMPMSLKSDSAPRLILYSGVNISLMS